MDLTKCWLVLYNWKNLGMSKELNLTPKNQKSISMLESALRLAFRVHVAAQQPSDTVTSQKRGCGGMLTAFSTPAMSIAVGPR